MVKLNSEMKAGTDAATVTDVQVNHVSQTIAKPNVVRRLESCMSKFGEAHNMLARTKLSKEDYQPISTLLASAKVELFNIYYELKNNQL